MRAASFLEVHPLGSEWSESCFDKLVFPGWGWQLRSASDILFLYERVALFVFLVGIAVFLFSNKAAFQWHISINTAEFGFCEWTPIKNFSQNIALPASANYMAIEKLLKGNSHSLTPIKHQRSSSWEKHCYYTITLFQWFNQLVSSPADLVFQAVYSQMGVPAFENASF